MRAFPDVRFCACRALTPMPSRARCPCAHAVMASVCDESRYLTTRHAWESWYSGQVPRYITPPPHHPFPPTVPSVSTRSLDPQLVAHHPRMWKVRTWLLVATSWSASSTVRKHTRQFKYLATAVAVQVRHHARKTLSFQKADVRGNQPDVSHWQYQRLSHFHLAWWCYRSASATSHSTSTDNISIIRSTFHNEMPRRHGHLPATCSRPQGPSAIAWLLGPDAASRCVDCARPNARHCYRCRLPDKRTAGVMHRTCARCLQEHLVSPHGAPSTLHSLRRGRGAMHATAPRTRGDKTAAGILTTQSTMQHRHGAALPSLPIAHGPEQHRPVHRSDISDNSHQRRRGVRLHT